MEKKHQEIPIGFKNGCFSIIGGTEIYQKEKIKPRVDNAKQMRQKYLNGELEIDSMCEELLIDPVTHKGINYNIIGTQESLDKYIKDLKSKSGYKIQCSKCGKVFWCSENSNWWLYKKFRYCSDDCFTDIVYDKTKNFDVDYTNTIHESLKILECVDENYEEQSWIEKTRNKRIKHIKLCKKYKCRCYLCQSEYIFKSLDFEIRSDDYGRNADIGYYSDAYCKCHKISSFQWRTIKIFNENNIKYKVEMSFPDLIGNVGLLRYDFAIVDEDNSIKYLIECQGIQHRKPVKEFGGTRQFEYQLEKDKLKRNYAERNNITLIEVPDTCNTYEKEVKFLKEKEVI